MLFTLHCVGKSGVVFIYIGISMSFISHCFTCVLQIIILSARSECVCNKYEGSVGVGKVNVSAARASSTTPLQHFNTIIYTLDYISLFPYFCILCHSFISEVVKFANVVIIENTEKLVKFTRSAINYILIIVFVLFQSIALLLVYQHRVAETFAESFSASVECKNLILGLPEGPSIPHYYVACIFLLIIFMLNHFVQKARECLIGKFFTLAGQ